MLVQVHPMKTWRLPPSQDVVFKVNDDPTCYGQYEPDPHTITLSRAKLEHLDNVIKTMAHEVVHLKLYQMRSKSWETHDHNFAKYAVLISEEFGFDPKEF
jgi:predicted SprT family Zn-dependent metalloprotease